MYVLKSAEKRKLPHILKKNTKTSRRLYTAETMTDANYADDPVLLVNIPLQAVNTHTHTHTHLYIYIYPKDRKMF